MTPHRSPPAIPPSPRRPGVLHALTATVATLAAALSTPALAQVPCERNPALKVPGAECQATYQLPNLMTAYLALTGHTDPSDYLPLHSARSRNPQVVVPGIQIDGYFPDTSRFNTYHRWNHDAQFVIRLPDNWNGKLVITGAPANRKQYSLDYIIGDFVLSRGYAFASTDKGNSGLSFYNDGRDPGDAVAEWHLRVAELTRAAKEVVRQRYGRYPSRTYMTGISNGGYLTRYQLENYAELYDGGVDWEGTLFTAEGPNLFTYLPAALKHYPQFLLSGQDKQSPAYKAMIAAGFAEGSEVVWEHHYTVYWDLTQRIYREEFDPSFDGSKQAGTAFCPSGSAGCDTDYDYQSRRSVRDPATGVSVEEAVKKVSLTGRIGKPMLTLHGTIDALLPIATDSDVYTEMVRKAGRQSIHRYYIVEGATHVDSLADEFPTQVRPLLPCYRAALVELDRWVEGHPSYSPPKNKTIPWVRGTDVANECSLY